MLSKFTSALIGGAAGAIIAVTFQVLQNTISEFLGIFACLSYILCGLIAVWHYTNEYSVTLRPPQSIRLGALAGLCGAIVGSFLYILLQSVGVLPSNAEILEEAMAVGDANAARIAEFMVSAGGIVVGTVIGTVMGLVGGVIGGAIWKKGDESEAEAE